MTTLSPLRGLRPPAGRWRANRLRARTVSRLKSLPDGALRDLGVARDDIPQAVRRAVRLA